MGDSTYSSEMSQNEFSNFKKSFFKYLFFWKYFVLSITIFLFFNFLFLRYTPKSYTNTAKIKILDDKKESVDFPFSSDFFNRNSINLENEIQLINSTNIIRQVIRNLNLNYEVYAKGSVVSNLVNNYPFEIICDTNYINHDQNEFVVRFEDNNLIVKMTNNDVTKDYF